MEKDFTIDVEVRLTASWPTRCDSIEEWKRRNQIDARLGLLASKLEGTVEALIEARVEHDIQAPTDLQIIR